MSDADNKKTTLADLIKSAQTAGACDAVIEMRDMLIAEPNLDPWDACARMLQKLEPEA